MLGAYYLYQFAQLLCASGKAADFQRDNGVALLGDIQKHLELLLCLCVAVFVFKDDFISASGFEFLYLSVDVLIALVCGATCISVY